MDSVEQLFYTTTYLRTRSSSGETRSATAFVFEFKSEDNVYPFLVTSKRAVNDVAHGRITFMKGDAKGFALFKPYVLEIDHFSKLWSFHPDSDLNVAVTPFVPFVKHIESSGVPVCFSTISHIASKQELVSAFLRGVKHIGYPDGSWDSHHYIPILQSAFLSSLPSVDSKITRTSLLEKVFLPGTEGSPVVYFDEAEQQAMLVGIMLENKGLIDTPDMPVNNSFCRVIHADVITETITSYLKEKGLM